jgi:hypothetical protein
MNRLFAGRATAARMARKYGINEEEIETQEDTQEKPVILDHKPQRDVGTRR